MHDPITELDKKQGNYLNVLERTELSLFPGLNVKRILFNETAYCLKKSKTDFFKGLIKCLLFKDYFLDSRINGQEILLLYSKNYRSDHDGYWEQIKKDVKNYDSITILTQGQRKLELKNLARKIKYLRICYRELNVINNKNDRLYLALWLVDRKIVMDEINQLYLTPKIVMCFSDNSVDENVLMQYFKTRGITTVTNQHGLCVFQSYDYDRLNQSQILNFKCDYFFARGVKQKEQFVLAGFDGGNIKVVGYIEKNNKDIQIKDNNTIGIYLDCPTVPLSDKNNKRMIEYGKLIAKALGWKYLVKCHPQDLIDKYKNEVDDDCLDIFGKGTTLEETLKKVSICIIHASATYVDVYTYGLRCLKMNSEIKYPIAVKEDEFDTSEQAIDKITVWNRKSKEEKKSYIRSVLEQYASPWEKGNIDRELQKIKNEIKGDQQ